MYPNNLMVVLREEFLMAYQRVFVAVDDSPVQNKVFDKAVEIAGKNNAILRIGHVVNTGPIEAAGSYPDDLLPQLKAEFDEKLAPLVEKAKANPNIKEVQFVNMVGHIRETLMEEIIEPFNPDLVVCGARGLSPIRYALLGSVSTFLVKHVKCDVLVVKDL